MGAEASSENDRRARDQMVSYKQFVRDILLANKLCASNFVDGRTGCHLSFEPVTNLTHHELLPVMWRQEGRLLIIVHRQHKPSPHHTAPPPALTGSEAAGGANVDTEHKSDAALRASKSLTVHQFYHLFVYVTQNAPLLQQARARLSKMRQQRQQQQQQQQQQEQQNEPAADEADVGVCSICLSADVEVALPCLHAFCSACIEDWHTHDQSCPLCRMKADVNGAASDVWLMEGGSEAELIEQLDSINHFPHFFLQDKPDFAVE